MSLTNEEQMELDQLESELGNDTASKAGLTASEQAELETLEKEVGQAVPQQPVEEDTNLAMETGATLLAASRKVAKGFIPFNNQASAALATGLDYVTDPVFDAILGTSTTPSTFGEKYSRNIELIREQEEADNERLGLAGTALEITGAAVGLGKLSKALGLSSKGALNIAKTGLVDAVYAGISYTDSKGYDKDTMEVMKMGGGMSVAAQVAMGPLGRLAKGVGKVGSALLGKTDEALLGANVARYADKTAEGIRSVKMSHGDDAVIKSMKELDMMNPDFANDIPKHKEHVRKVLDETGQKIRTAYEALDAYTGGVPVDATDLIDKIRRTVYYSRKSSAGREEVMKKVMPEIDNMFKNSVDGTYTVKTVTDLFDTITDMNQGNVLSKVKGKDKDIVFKVMRDQLKHSRSKVSAQLEMGVAQSKRMEELAVNKEALEEYLKVATKNSEDSVPLIKKRIEDVGKNIAELEKMGVTPNVNESAAKVIRDPESIGFVLESLEKNNEKFSRLSEFNKKVLSNTLPTTTGGYMVNALRKLATPKAIAGVLAGNALGGPLGGAAAAGVVGLGSKSASKMGAIVESYARQTKEETVRQGLLKMGDFFKSTAQYNTDPVFRGLSAVVAKNLGSDEASADESWVNINSAMSKAKLYTNPLERDNDSVINNFDDIMAIAAKDSPALAESLANAMNNQEDMGPFMDELSKSPEMAKFFKAGLGWGGKVYSEEDKAMIVNEIQSQLDVPSVVKSQYIANVLSTGEIPDMNSIPRRERVQYVPRDRNKVR